MRYLNVMGLHILAPLPKEKHAEQAWNLTVQRQNDIQSLLMSLPVSHNFRAVLHYVYVVSSVGATWLTETMGTAVKGYLFIKNICRLQIYVFKLCDVSDNNLNLLLMVAVGPGGVLNNSVQHINLMIAVSLGLQDLCLFKKKKIWKVCEWYMPLLNNLLKINHPYTFF